MDDNLSETPSATLDFHDELYHQGVQKASKQRPVAGEIAISVKW